MAVWLFQLDLPWDPPTRKPLIACSIRPNEVLRSKTERAIPSLIFPLLVSNAIRGCVYRLVSRPVPRKFLYDVVDRMLHNSYSRRIFAAHRR
jgi:hypothetical protein